jgi:hypothetical protein
MGANPYPGHRFAGAPAEGAIVISNSDAEALFASLQTPETE